MKKSILFFSVLLISSTSLCARVSDGEQQQILKHSTSGSFRRELDFFGGRSSRQVLLYGGAPIVAGFTPLATNLSSDVKIASGVFGVVGGMVGALWAYGDRYDRRGHMNRLLNEYTKHTQFKELDRLEQAMILASETQNIEAMRSLLSYLPHFVKEKGIWETLTELYYLYQPDATQTSTSAHVPVHFTGSKPKNEPAFHVTGSQGKIKHSYMAPDVMRRRMAALKEKLGWVD